MKKVLSVLLSILMLASSLPFGAFAEERVLPEKASLPESEEALNLGEKLPSAKEALEAFEHRPDGVKLPAPEKASSEASSEVLEDTALETEVSAPPVSDVKSEATIDTTGECTWRRDGTRLTISGNGKMADYTYYEGSPWKNNYITELVIENGVTGIGTYAFSGMRSLTSVTFPDTLVSVGSCAFQNCSVLQTVNITNLASWCGITFQDTVANPLSATLSPMLFLNGSGIVDLVIPASVTDLGNYTFCDYDHLRSVTFHSSLKRIGAGAFYDCNGITSVTLPDSLTNLGAEAFWNCVSLSTVNGGKSLWAVGAHVFEKTPWLDAQPNGLIYLGNVVYGIKGTCPSELVIPDGTVGIAGSAFSIQWDLLTVVIPDSVTIIVESAFSACINLRAVHLGNSVKTIGRGAFFGTDLRSIEIPESVKELGEEVFDYCSSLRFVSLPKQITSIGWECFNDCEKLEAVWYAGNEDDLFQLQIQNGNDVLYDIGWYVDSCAPYQHVGSEADLFCTECAFPFFSDYGETGECYWLTAGATLAILGEGSMGDYSISSYSPWGTSIRDVVFGEGVENVGAYAFYRSKYLNSVYFSDTVKTIGHRAFEQCARLEKIDVPDTVETISSYAFYGCTSLTSIRLSDSVTEILTGTFDGCTALSSVAFPASLKTITENAFRNCKALASLHFLGELEVIERYAFSLCEGITEIWLPRSIKTIGLYALRDCTKLEKVYYEGNRTEWRRINIDDSNRRVIDAVKYYLGCDENHRFASACDSICNKCYEVREATAAHTFADENPICTRCGVHRDLKHTVDEEGFAVIIDCDASVSGLVEIPETLDGVPVTTIGEGAFADCAALEVLCLPTSVTTIVKDSFVGCTALTTVLYKGSAEEFAKISVESGNDALTGAEFHGEACLENPESFAHIYDNACDKSCNACGKRRVTEPHVFDDENDQECNICGAPPYVPGDLDDVEGVTSADAIYLLYYTLFGEARYPVNQNVDFDGSGKVDSADAIYLLYHTLFGEARYPLA